METNESAEMEIKKSQKERRKTIRRKEILALESKLGSVQIQLN